MALVRGSTARSQRSGSPLFLPAYQLQAVQPMTLFIFAYAAGLLTIASPCIFPILPFVLGRAED
jgi:cytochrome c biogenesis protein CcdA